ncbi:MAG: serine/threonine protein kinase [Pirellulaceae bacterium]|nr:serine/threonine protein kinase [Pirellulaceae bacterium]
MTAETPSYEFLEPPKREGEIGRLGPYRVFRQLGRGGMGEVFQAVDSRLKRNVALKVMNKKVAGTKHSRRRFVDEARSMAAIHHENVVIIFEVGVKNETPFMAMEMLKGKTLLQWKQSGRLFSDEEIIEMGMQMSRGLAAAHQCGIVHRDIKPANIWIEETTGRVKILDFGLALAGVSIDSLSGRGSVVGSPGYLSPEQARDDPLDDRSDLYSLGVVLYELCVGKLPSTAKSMPGHLIAILEHDPPSILELNPDIKPALADVIHCLLSKEARDRPSNAVHLEEMLEYAAQAPYEQELEPLEPLDEEVAEVADAGTGSIQPAAASISITPTDSGKPGAASQTSSNLSGSLNVSGKSTTASKRSAKKKRRSRKAATAPADVAHGDSTQVNGLKWPLVIAALSLLLVSPVIYWLVTRPDVVPNDPLPETPITQRPTAPQVTLAMLKPLSLTAATVESDSVQLGNAVQCTVTLKNEAQDASGDPRVATAKARDAAVLAVYAKIKGGDKKRMATQKLRPRDLPAPGREMQRTIPVFTSGLEPKSCELIFELQTPKAELVSSTKAAIEIVAPKRP